MKLSPKKIAALFGGWLVATNVLVLLVHITDAWPLKILLFACVSVLSGAALLRALRATPGSFLEWLVYSIGLSVLVLMLSGLAANQILYHLGVARPLELAGILGTWDVVTAGCIAAGLFTNREVLRYKRRAWVPPNKSTRVLLVASLLLPILAIGGAFRLNNGGDALIACIALFWATAIIVYTFIFRNRLSDNTLAWTVFTLGLSILLMTSLRSWDITGHDIMREFHVYSLTHGAGRWNIDAYHDPYNACLSITILPEMYAKLLHVSGLVSFKVILQVLFAVCPVVIYITLRRYVSKLGALVGCALFLSYPTFINDSAMLTRQGVAYLFFSLALLATMREDRERLHKWLFIACGVGVVLSHYSTSYMFVAIFAIALICKLCIQRVRGWRWQLNDDRFSMVTPLVLAMLMLSTFLWYGQFTATSGGLLLTLKNSIANAPHLLSADNKSSDTSAALVLSSHKTQLDVYQSYLAHPVHNSKITQAAEYRPEIAADDIPLTTSGKRAATMGIQPTITNDLRQNFAKVLQLLAAVSVFYLTYLSVFYATYLFARKKKSTLPLDLICFSIAGIVLLVLMVVMPTVSLNYGVLRAFQQSLIFLLIPLTISLSVLGRVLRPKIRTAVAALGIAALFLLFTGVFAQLSGGVGAALTLNNQGLYYGLYYTTEADLRSYRWLKEQVPAKSDVRAASFAKALMHDPKYPFSTLGILPSQRPSGTYVYLDQAQVVARKFYVYSDGSPLITTFPLDYYNDWTNQIYSTTTTGVYR